MCIIIDRLAYSLFEAKVRTGDKMIFKIRDIKARLLGNNVYVLHLECAHKSLANHISRKQFVFPIDIEYKNLPCG